MDITLDSAMTQRPSWARRLFLSELRKMRRGRLRLVLPDGQRLQIGKTDEVSAAIIVHSERFFKKCLWFGDIGFGEAYVDGDWETDDVTRVIQWFILNVSDNAALSGSGRRWSPTNILKSINLWIHWRRQNKVSQARQNISAHYDLSNDFFKLFLDPTMTYSSALFENKDISLESAQIAKYDRLCRQAKLQATDHVLEIGTGWGGFAVYAAKTYGCRVTTITISREQFEYAKQRVARAGLESQIRVDLKDYRHVEGSFDKIVSIEMLEAVGHRYLKTFFRKCQAVLNPDGVIALQVITCPDSRYDQFRKGVDWIQKYIFPGSLLPSISAIQSAIQASSSLMLYDAKNLGRDYARTLATWRERFNSRRLEIQKLGFDEPFMRKWNYYFSYCEAAFASRNINVMQLVFAFPNTRSL